MTDDELKDHERWYSHYFGYPRLTSQNRCKRGALTDESKY